MGGTPKKARNDPKYTFFILAHFPKKSKKNRRFFGIFFCTLQMVTNSYSFYYK